MASDTSDRILSVSELNRQARISLEKSLPSCRVRGEIANYSRAGSGHWYFTLKDGQASVRCVMFRPRNQFVEWAPSDGDQVEIRAQPTLYEQRGDYQLLVDAMRKAGQGALFEAFLKLKAKLESEGLFDLNRKRAIPKYPGSIGIVTSPQAAALRDVLTVLRNRWPICPVILYPAPVQGDEAPKVLATAVTTAGMRRDCDILLIVRGGGSLEDLSAFNDERLARTIAASPIPIISGIGHETDFTIADFVADKRAPTPTGAAQLATPSRIDLQAQVEQLSSRMNRGLVRILHSISQRLDGLSRRVAHPRERVEIQHQQLKLMTWRLRMMMQNRSRLERTRLNGLQLVFATVRTSVTERNGQLARSGIRLLDAACRSISFRKDRLRGLSSQLALLSPSSVLARGYGIIRSKQEIIRDSSQVRIGQAIEIVLGRGLIGASVRKITGD